MENVRNIDKEFIDKDCIGELGSLTLFRHISNEDMELFIDIITNDFSPFCRVLYNIIKDKQTILKIFDAFEGQRVYFPDRKKFYKTLEKCVIYNYIVDHDYSPESYSTMSKQYSKRVSQIRNIVDRIDNLKKGGLYSFAKEEDDDE